MRAARELLAGALGALVAAPREWALLVEQGRGRAARVVAETLRHDAPVKVHAFTAVATAEVAGERIAAGDEVAGERIAAGDEVAGERIAAGDEVAVVVGAAYRDPRVFEDPDVFAAGRVLRGGVRALVPAPYGIAPEPFEAAVAETVLVALAAARHPPCPAPRAPASSPG
ncbi:hypothetical protein ABZ114_11145 [Streptomyces albidoflavus]|uniref:hypothetical protein n=1 Tax=Streptomyces albidoflavus TaxID=1886 RepID=UPI0033BD6F2D